jgi:hypothetical protein
MKLLIDECLPRALKRLFTVPEVEFDVLVTIDQSIRHRQNLVGRRIAILILGAQSNQIEDLAPLIPAALTRSPEYRPRCVARVGEDRER